MKKLQSFFFLLCTLVFLLCAAAAGEENDILFPTLIDRTEQADAWPEFQFDPEARLLEIWMPDIRDADAAILTCGGDTWMIDCGDLRAARRLVLLMKQLGVKKIDRLFNSHPHPDHLSGLRLVAENADVEELLICYPDNINDPMREAMAVAAEKGIRVASYGDGDSFSMGDGAVKLQIWQKVREGMNMNDTSAQTMVRYGNRSMLFTADAEKTAQRLLLAEVGAEQLKADILKYPHHGKLTLVDEYLEAVSPQLAVITNYRGAGDSGRYLKDRGVAMAYTNRTKIFLHLATDGIRWLCEYVPIG